MEYKLDLRDRKILYELDLNSRQSFNELARKVRLSKTAVLHRINNLKKEGIIKQFHTIIDTGKLGFIGFRLYISLQNTTPKKKKEIIGFFNKNKLVSWVVSIEGDYDIGVLILTKSIKEMNDFWKEFLENYVNYTKERLLTIMTKVSYFSRAYLLNLKRNIYEINLITEPEEMIIDKKDKEILKLLAMDSRISVVDISSKTSLASKTIIHRIKQLENKGVIVGYKTVFDLEKLGYKYFKAHFRLNNVTKEKEKKFRTYVKSSPNIIYDDGVLGGDDFEIEIQIKDLNELRSLLEDIYSEFAEIIKEHKIMQFYEEHKFLLFPQGI
jgi:Lrp/AsnC family leucine-responsive transcriptional regulator